MGRNPPAPRSSGQFPGIAQGLTPGRITAWIRDEGFRAKVELEGDMLRIVTGLAGYAVTVWCPQTLSLEDHCEDLLFDVRLKLGGNAPPSVLCAFLRSFNVNLAPSTVAILEPLNVIVVRMSFMVEATSSTLLFSRYFMAFDRILQNFSKDLAMTLKAHGTPIGKAFTSKVEPP